jgi:hypothetical protein
LSRYNASKSGGAAARNAPATEAARGWSTPGSKLGHLIERGIHAIKSRRSLLSINTTASHNPELAKPTDKKRHPETTETKVAQVI